QLSYTGMSRTGADSDQLAASWLLSGRRLKDLTTSEEVRTVKRHFSGTDLLPSSGRVTTAGQRRTRRRSSWVRPAGAGWDRSVRITWHEVGDEGEEHAMTCSKAAYRARPWRVHSLAPDFEVIDVWRVNLRGGQGGFARFVEVFWEGVGEAERWALS